MQHTEYRTIIPALQEGKNLQFPDLNDCGEEDIGNGRLSCVPGKIYRYKSNKSRLLPILNQTLYFNT